jgi:homogentisate 1,2-dioxygenase
MPYYRAVGELPHKRHIQFRRPDGNLYAEELMGEAGFSGSSALLYHRNPPTAIAEAEVWEMPDESLEANVPLLPRHFRTHKLDRAAADAVSGRQLLLANKDVRISYAVVEVASPLYRNAVGDECVFIEEGEAVLETVFGHLSVHAGDYVIIPTSTTHRWVPTSQQMRLLILEARGHIQIPRRYCSPDGQLLERAPYSERDLRGPVGPAVADDGEVDVFVRHSTGGTRYRYAHHPFDVVGWDGCLYPFAFDIADFEPEVGRVHLPPPVHQTFEGPNFVVCSFCPRPFDFDPLAIPVPYYHANVDSDEVLFYVSGDFMSRGRAGIEAGSISLHPGGHIHGPQPGVVEGSLGKGGTGERAVMIDTFSPLEIGRPAAECEDSSYISSWLELGMS